MDQPLDFSKSTKKCSKRLNSPSTNNFSNEYHINNSENSDENVSRSTASTPDSMNTEQSTSSGSCENSFSQQALFMLAAVSNPNYQNLAAMNFGAQQLINGTNDSLKTNIIHHLKNLNVQPINSQISASASPIINSQNLNSSAAHAAAVCVSNIINQQPQFSSQFSSYSTNTNQSNAQPSTSKQSKSNHEKMSKSAAQKAPQRKSFMAKQQDEECKIKKSYAKFNILANSQNSNILQLSANIDRDSHSPMLSNSLQLSINSNNTSGEENSLLSEIYSVDGGSPRSRRRGNPIPDSLKDDSYWFRRRKNNEAAKKSRDAKRAKDMVTAKRAIHLENENSYLRSQLNQLRNENLILRSIVGEEMSSDLDQKKEVDNMAGVARNSDPEKIRVFIQEFFKVFGPVPEEMEP